MNRRARRRLLVDWLRHSGACAAASLLTACAGAGAGAGGPSQSTRDDAPCRSTTTAIEMSTCWAEAARAAEAAADARWSQAAAAVESGGARASALLRETQDRWLRYRDSECALQAARLAGGSAAPTAAAVCRWRLARVRDIELKTVTDTWSAGVP